MAAKCYLDGWGPHSPRAQRRAATLEAGRPGSAKVVAPACSGKDGVGSSGAAQVLMVRVELPAAAQAVAAASAAPAGDDDLRGSIQAAVQRAVPGGCVSMTAVDAAAGWRPAF